MAMTRVTFWLDPEENIEISRDRKRCIACGTLTSEPESMEPRHWLNDHAKRYHRDGIKTEIRSNPNSGKIALYADMEVDMKIAKSKAYHREWYHKKTQGGIPSKKGATK